MRRLFIFVPLFLTALAALAGTDAEPADKVLAAAREQARIEKKNVFVVFRASW